MRRVCQHRITNSYSFSGFSEKTFRLSHLVTAKAGVIKFATLKVKGIMHNPNLALSVCGCMNSDMKNLNWRVSVCGECGHTEGGDGNASRNVYRYGKERRNRAGNGPACGEIGEAGRAIRRRDPAAGH